jgi:hypothetical protein
MNIKSIYIKSTLLHALPQQILQYFLHLSSNSCTTVIVMSTDSNDVIAVVASLAYIYSTYAIGTFWYNGKTVCLMSAYINDVVADDVSCCNINAYNAVVDVSDNSCMSSYISSVVIVFISRCQKNPHNAIVMFSYSSCNTVIVMSTNSSDIGAVTSFVVCYRIMR